MDFAHLQHLFSGIFEGVSLKVLRGDDPSQTVAQTGTLFSQNTQTSLSSSSWGS